ncbi:hypothetical protein FHX72_003670 [Pseudoclavibacter helvolus]|uniref:Uncharacterized protein n=1 Tax=Pseudoclavibacter helvolus TaxID=255205 RepID=A0A7W4US36_9MICO|nr:hypothetical protein [Pseudoclavibacter helvolus]
MLPDMAQWFHVDLDAVSHVKSWRWLRNHLFALLDIRDSRVRRSFMK